MNETAVRLVGIALVVPIVIGLVVGYLLDRSLARVCALALQSAPLNLALPTREALDQVVLVITASRKRAVSLKEAQKLGARTAYRATSGR